MIENLVTVGVGVKFEAQKSASIKLYDKLLLLVGQSACALLTIFSSTWLNKVGF